MFTRKQLLFSVLASMTMLVILAQVASAWSWNASDSWFIYETQNTSHYCGPASARMYLNYAKNKYGYTSPTVPSQDTLNTYGHSHNVSNPVDPDVDPRGEAWNLYAYTPAGYYYDDWVYDNAHSGLDGGAWTVAYYQEPIIVLTYGGAHFMVLRGVTADSNPYTNYPNANISQVCVSDPWDNKFGKVHGNYTLGNNNCMTSATWQANYYTTFDYPYTTPDWTNHWVNVERSTTSGTPTTKHGYTITSGLVAVALDSLLTKMNGTVAVPLDPKNPKWSSQPAPRIVDASAETEVLPAAVAEEAQRVRPISSDADIIAIAARGVELFGLNKKSGFGPALQGALPDAPILVNSLSPDFPDYYLVPFRQKGNVSAVVMVGTKSGQAFYMGATYSDLPISQYPFVSRPEALVFAQSHARSVAASARLVWKPSQESMEPYYPLWEMQAGNQTVYVDHIGQTHAQLTEP